MANVKVKTTAVVNRNPVGSTIELPKGIAEKLADKNYVTIIAESKPKPKPKKTQAKKSAKKEADKADK